MRSVCAKGSSVTRPLGRSSSALQNGASSLLHTATVRSSGEKAAGPQNLRLVRSVSDGGVPGGSASSSQRFNVWPSVVLAVKNLPVGLKAKSTHIPLAPLVEHKTRSLAISHNLSRPSSPLAVASQLVWRG